MISFFVYFFVANFCSIFVGLFCLHFCFPIRFGSVFLIPPSHCTNRFVLCSWFECASDSVFCSCCCFVGQTVCFVPFPLSLRVVGRFSIICARWQCVGRWLFGSRCDDDKLAMTKGLRSKIYEIFIVEESSASTFVACKYHAAWRGTEGTCFHFMIMILQCAVMLWCMGSICLCDE